MCELMQTGWLITGIGMGLVFAVIITLWGLMALLMKLTSREKKTKLGNDAESNLPIATVLLQEDQNHFQKKAAAAAVAIGLGLIQSIQSSPQINKQNTEINTWQAVTRARQLQNQIIRGRR
ncbi:MAG: OadG family protein [Chloroflexota bacterium]